MRLLTSLQRRDPEEGHRPGKRPRERSSSPHRRPELGETECHVNTIPIQPASDLMPGIRSPVLAASHRLPLNAFAATALATVDRSNGATPTSAYSATIPTVYCIASDASINIPYL